MTMQNAIKNLSLVLQTPGALSPFIWGDPGIGKTQRIQQIAKSLNRHLETLIASIRTPEDFGGMPVPNNEGGLSRIPDGWVNRVLKHNRAIIFADELSCAPPAVQAAALRPVLEGYVGDHYLDPEKYQWIAAANRPEVAAGGFELPAPMANRFWHTVWTADAEEHVAWLAGARVTATDLPVVDLERWKREYATAKAIQAAFIKRNPTAICEQLDEKIMGRFPLAYTTPRTLECTARLHATCRVIGEPELLAELATGAIGEPNALTYAAYVREMDLPDPYELLNDPDSYVPDKERLDRTFATLLAVAHVATTKPIKTKLWKAAWDILVKALPLGKDIVVVPVMTLADRNNRPKGGLTTTPAVKKVAAEVREVVAVAGLLD